jgi:amino acid transporter
MDRRIGELRHGILSVVDSFAQSVALLSLALGVAFASSAAAGEAGIAAPFAYLIAGVGSLCLGSVIIRFTRRMASAGGLYTYISRGLNPSAGFLGGWLYGGGFAVGISFVLVIGSFFMSTAFTAHTSLHWGWFPWFFILFAAVAVISLLDVKLSSRIQLIAAGVGVGAILVLAFAILFQGGDHGVSLAPLNPANAPSTSDLFLAVVLTFTGFIGFEAAAAFGEEAVDPLRAIPKAILTAVLVAVVFYVFVTWMMAIGFGNAAAWAKDPAALDTLATRYVGNWLAVIIDFSVAASGFIAALAGTNLTSRTAYAMGREGGLPRVFAWTHPRFRTPWVGIFFSLIVTLLLAVLFAHHYDPITYFIWMASTATIGILITYILVAVGGITYFARDRTGWNVLLDLVVPAIAIAICGYTLYKSIHPTPAYSGIFKWIPWAAIIYLAVGVLVDVWLTMTKPDRVRAFGSILAASEGAEAAAPEAPAPTMT